MKVAYVSGVDAQTLLDPKGPLWEKVRGETFKLEGTPPGMQPTEMLRTKYENKPVGSVKTVEVKAVHNGEALAFHLRWAMAHAHLDNGDNTVFPDGAAVALPVVPNAPLITMGAVGMPVNAWFWRASTNGQGREVVAEGVGSSETLDLNQVRGQGVYESGHWTVSIVRALQVAGQSKLAALTPGQTTGFGVAVWDGGAGERGGIKAFTGPQWLELILAARS
jgi:steroid C-25 hydroxylase gamma subunit